MIQKIIADPQMSGRGRGYQHDQMRDYRILGRIRRPIVINGRAVIERNCQWNHDRR